MAQHGDEGILFDEDEIGRILQRTAELQGRRLNRPSTGLTLDELKTLASESGLDPNLVVTAVAELQSRKSGDRSTWWGGPTVHEMDLVLPGPVSDEAWERMLDAVRSVIGQIGRVEVRGTTREWIKDAKEEGTCRFSVRESPDGPSHVQLHWNAPLSAILAYIADAVLTIIALVVIGEELALGLLPGIAAFLAVAGTLFLLMRWIVSKATERNQAKVDELTRIVAAIGAAEAPSSRSERTQSAGVHRSQRADDVGTLDIDDVPESTDTGSRTGATRQRT